MVAGSGILELQCLLEAGIARVVYEQSDDNPTAAGGAATLRAAGVDPGLRGEALDVTAYARIAAVRPGDRPAPAAREA